MNHEDGLGTSASRKGPVPLNPKWIAIGQGIKKARGLANLTQEELGNRLPEGRTRTRAAIAQYEKGTNAPSLQTILDIAEALQVSADDLFSGGGKSGPASPGEAIAVSREAGESDVAILPTSLLQEFGVAGKQLELFRIDIDAGSLGGAVGDYVLVDVGSTAVGPNGQRYAVLTPGGVTVMRAEPFGDGKGNVMMTTGQNLAMPLPPDVSIVGKVIAKLQKSI